MILDALHKREDVDGKMCWKIQISLYLLYLVKIIVNFYFKSKGRGGEEGEKGDLK